jgi:hypothetical protein
VRAHCASKADFTPSATAVIRSECDLAGDLGQNACAAAAGYCQPGDFVQPMCKMGWHEDHAIEMANPGVCGLGICCVSDDCRISGCAAGSYCSGCLGANGAIDYVCIGNGSAC